MNFQFDIREIVSNEEKMKAFEIRKIVFGDEMNDNRFIVDDKYFIDPWDNSEATIVITETKESKRIIGTFRAYYRKTGEYIYDDLYFSKKLLEIVRLPKEIVLSQPLSYQEVVF